MSRLVQFLEACSGRGMYLAGRQVHSAGAGAGSWKPAVAAGAPSFGGACIRSRICTSEPDAGLPYMRMSGEGPGMASLRKNDRADRFLIAPMGGMSA